MAVTINELIAKREAIKNKKNNLYDLETSIGTIVVKIPSGGTISDAWEIKNSFDGNKYLIYESVVEPNLKAPELQNAYECVEPIDIVSEIFTAGEINKIAGKILDLSGYGGKIVSKLHKEVKNS